MVRHLSTQFKTKTYFKHTNRDHKISIENSHSINSTSQISGSQKKEKTKPFTNFTNYNMMRRIECEVFREASYQIWREQKAAGKKSGPHEDDEDDNPKLPGEQNRIERRFYPIPDGIAAQQQ